MDHSDTIISGETLIVEYDFNNPNIYETTPYSSSDSIYSISKWLDATNTGTTLDNIGLTGLDNGLLRYNKNILDTENTGLTQILTATTLDIFSASTELILTPISGSTTNYIYPIDILSGSSVGYYSQLCGGFYQGFYKIDNTSYQVLPNRYEKGWTMECWINKNDNCSYTGTTLNDIYPDNKGFIFYLGTRAENKFWTVFEGLNTGTTSGCTSGCTDFCTVPKETDVTTTSGYPLSPPPLIITDIYNQFLIYSRATNNSNCTPCNCSHEPKRHGYTACDFSGDHITITATTMAKNTDTRNPFQIYSRASGNNKCGCGHNSIKGETACSYTGNTQPLLELDYLYDIVDNNFGVRIKDDGSIGYRALRKTCITGTTSGQTVITSGYTVEESYSNINMVSEDEWTHIVVKFVAYDQYDKCQLMYYKPRLGKLMFYVNSKLKFVIKDFEEIIPKRLNEFYQKQEGVPFNMSVGGGTQGLIDSMTFDGQDPDDIELPLEKYFAGSFIGGLSRFRFYDVPLTWCEIKHNYEIEVGDFI